MESNKGTKRITSIPLYVITDPLPASTEATSSLCQIPYRCQLKGIETSGPSPIERFLQEPSHKHGIAFVRLDKVELGVLGICANEYNGEVLDLSETGGSIETNVRMREGLDSNTDR
jgi:hypothetical protein